MTLLFLFVLFLNVFSFDNGNFAELLIRGPQELVAELNGTQILGRPALFGFPEYNGEFVGHLRLAPASNRLGCDHFDEQAFFSLQDEIIAVIDRGTCHFVTKVYNAQIAGAKGVVIVNNVYGDFLPFMADDGLGSVIDIPSILIQKEYGLILKEWLIEDRVVETEIKWGLTGAGEAVEWQMFTTVVPSPEEIQFMKDLRPVVRALGDRQQFQIRLKNQEFLYDQDDCYKTFYCYEGEVIQGEYVSGYYIIKETLRQLCVWQVGNQTNDAMLWWDYRVVMDDRFSRGLPCFDGHSSDSIVADLSKERNANLMDLIDLCESNQDTELLAAEQEAFQDYRVSWTPRITVNGDFYHGKFGCPDVNVETCSMLAAMCSTYDEPIPQACEEVPEESNPISYAGEASLRPLVIFLFVGFLFIVILGGIALWRLKRRVNQTSSDFQAMRNIYHPLEEDNQVQYPTDANINSSIQSGPADV